MLFDKNVEGEYSNKIKFDWTINITQLIAIVSFVAAGFGSWYALKQEVMSDRQENKVRFEQIQKFMEQQVARDDKQDAAREIVIREFKQDVKDRTNEIRAEIRDLRNDLMPPQPYRRPTIPRN